MVFESINNIFFQNIFQSESIHKGDKINMCNVYAYIHITKMLNLKLKHNYKITWIKSSLCFATQN